MARERPPAGRFAPAAVPLREGDTCRFTDSAKLLEFLTATLSPLRSSVKGTLTPPAAATQFASVPLTKGDSRWSEATGRGSLTSHVPSVSGRSNRNLTQA